MPDHGSNGHDELVKSLVDRWEEQLDILLTYASEHMHRCKGPRGQIKAIKAEAKDAGIDKAALEHAVAERESAKKLARKFAKMEADQQRAVENIRDILGPFADTPLGAAAVAREEHGGLESLARGDEEQLEQVGRG